MARDPDANIEVVASDDALLLVLSHWGHVYQPPVFKPFDAIKPAHIVLPEVNGSVLSFGRDEGGEDPEF